MFKSIYSCQEIMPVTCKREDGILFKYKIVRVQEYMDWLKLSGGIQMNRAFQLSDEQYARLAAYAAQYKQTPETLFQTWVNELTQKVKESAASNQLEQKNREAEVSD